MATATAEEMTGLAALAAGGGGGLGGGLSSGRLGLLH